MIADYLLGAICLSVVVKENKERKHRGNQANYTTTMNLL